MRPPWWLLLLCAHLRLIFASEEGHTDSGSLDEFNCRKYQDATFSFGLAVSSDPATSDPSFGSAFQFSSINPGLFEDVPSPSCRHDGIDASATHARSDEPAIVADITSGLSSLSMPLDDAMEHHVDRSDPHDMQANDFPTKGNDYFSPDSLVNLTDILPLFLEHLNTCDLYALCLVCKAWRLMLRDPRLPLLGARILGRQTVLRNMRNVLKMAVYGHRISRKALDEASAFIAFLYRILIYLQTLPPTASCEILPSILSEALKGQGLTVASPITDELVEALKTIVVDGSAMVLLQGCELLKHCPTKTNVALNFFGNFQNLPLCAHPSLNFIKSMLRCIMNMSSSSREEYEENHILKDRSFQEASLCFVELELILRSIIINEEYPYRLDATLRASLHPIFESRGGITRATRVNDYFPFNINVPMRTLDIDLLVDLLEALRGFFCMSTEVSRVFHRLFPAIKASQAVCMLSFLDLLYLITELTF